MMSKKKIPDHIPFPENYKRILFLAWFTILYNLLEGIISILFGLSDETLALFGFGIDSFVEVLSGIGILHMVLRISKNPSASALDKFESTALRVTGTAFFILTAGLVTFAIMNILSNQRPETTFPGIIISLISLSIMFWLMRAKNEEGKRLQSQAILADAACTRTCIQLSVILLVASLINQITSLPHIDAVGSLVIAWISFKEGLEAFQKAKDGHLACSCDKDHCSK